MRTVGFVPVPAPVLCRFRSSITAATSAAARVFEVTNPPPPPPVLRLTTHSLKAYSSSSSANFTTLLPGYAEGQGRTLVHFSAQLEPCLSQEFPLHTPNTSQHPLMKGYTTPTRNPLSHTKRSS